jgi:sugar-specific transcriptional regulator TrmB
MTLESLLSDRKPRTAMEIARLTQSRLESVYERLVSLEAKEIVKVVDSEKRDGNKKRWVMA